MVPTPRMCRFAQDRRPDALHSVVSPVPGNTQLLAGVPPLPGRLLPPLSRGLPCGSRQEAVSWKPCCRPGEWTGQDAPNAKRAPAAGVPDSQDGKSTRSAVLGSRRRGAGREGQGAADRAADRLQLKAAVAHRERRGHSVTRGCALQRSLRLGVVEHDDSRPGMFNRSRVRYAEGALCEARGVVPLGTLQNS